MSRYTSSLVAALSLGIAQPVSAEQAGGWAILPADEYCTMFADFEGPGETRVSISVFPRKQKYLMVLTNTLWDGIIVGKQYPVRLDLPGSEKNWSGTANGMATDDPEVKGLAFPVTDITFLADFSRAANLTLYRESAFLVKVSLSGSRKAMERTLECAAKQLENSVADPFAGDVPGPNDPNRPPTPLNRPYWVLPADYPSLALRDRREGTTVVNFKVGSDGRVSDCIVQSSSSAADLDATACALRTRRARYAPASDAKNKPVSASDTQTVRWILPPAEPSQPPD